MLLRCHPELGETLAHLGLNFAGVRDGKFFSRESRFWREFPHDHLFTNFRFLESCPRLRGLKSSAKHVRVNTSRGTRPVRPQPPQAAPLDLGQNEPERDFEDLAREAVAIIEHLTVPGFLRRIPHRWHLDEITRFGDKVGRVAEALQLAYLTTIDRSLGVVRVFPAPMMRRVYDILAPQFGWPRILDNDQPLALEDVKRAKDALRANEKLAARLQELLDRTESAPVLEALATVMKLIERENEALRVQAESDPGGAK